MKRTPRPRFPGTDPQRAVGLLVGVAIAITAFAATLVGWENPLLRLGFLAHLAVGAVYLGLGCWVWLKRPRVPLGMLMCVGGFSLLLGAFNGSSTPAVWVLGAVASVAVLAVDVHLLVVFPFGRAESSADRALVVAGYVLVIGGMISSVLARPTPAAEYVRIGSAVVVVTLVGVATVSLVRRWLRWPRRRRSASLPVVLTTPIALALAVLTPSLGFQQPVSFVLQLVLITFIPFALARSALTGGLALQTALDDLDGDVRAGYGGDPQRLEGRLGRLLGDDSLQIGVWAPERGEYLDETGAVIPEPHGGRARVLVGEPDRVAAIDYDPLAIYDTADLQRASHILDSALERDRFATELLRSRDEVRRSRARIGAATDEERRRLATALHDGLQTQLVLLALDTARVRDRVDGEAGAELDALRDRISGLAADIRAIVHDVMPPVLTERGLVAALAEHLDRLPLRSTFAADVGAEPLDGPLERATYFMVSEALTNIVKHADATSVDVRLARTDAGLRVTVSDDGRGGATLGPGMGLRGAADRAAALGGTLDVAAGSPRGTTITMEVPID